MYHRICKKMLSVCMAILISIYSIMPPAFARQHLDLNGQVASDTVMSEGDSYAGESKKNDKDSSSNKTDGEAKDENGRKREVPEVDSMTESGSKNEETSISKDESPPENGSENDIPSRSLESEKEIGHDNDQYEDNKTDKNKTKLLPVYEDGTILIYSYRQLLLVGSNQPLYTSDAEAAGDRLGDIVNDGVGNIVRYGLESEYRFVQDIDLTDDVIWQVPDQFTGRIVSDNISSDKPLYDSESDTIYIYNISQLIALANDNTGRYPVMLGDAEQETFGMGQLIYPDGQEEGGNYVTYSNHHHYVLSSQFCYSYEKPKQRAPKAIKAAGEDRKAGRDFEGQVLKKIDGKTYILIGNQEQLRAIGSDEEVCTPVYQTDYHTFTGHVIDTDENGQPIMLYGGDADLTKSHNGRKDYTFHNIDPLVKPTTASVRYYVGVNQDTGQPYLDAGHATTNPNSLTEASWRTGEKYSSNANYIIFRDIDLEDMAWPPLMFSGTMFGAKSFDDGEKLWDGDTIGNAANIIATGPDQRPVISNIKVVNNDEMNVKEYSGVGFFATITNEINEDDIGISEGTAMVSNITLNNVDIRNNTSTVLDTDTLINIITTGLGGGLAALLTLVLEILSFGSLEVGGLETLTNLLDARTEDPTIFATGSFAGRIVGDVVVEGCIVTADRDHGITVVNVNDRTGGFVGYTEGMTQYSGLSQALGSLTHSLSSLLNIIPFIGLGDLITILLGNALPLSKLIVTGYINPVIRNSGVENLRGDIGSSDKDYAGGFVGQQIGTSIEDCFVCDSSYTANAKNYAGGFAGVTREAEIIGLLDGLGIDFANLAIRIASGIHPTEGDIHDAASGTDYQTVSDTLARTHPQSYLKECRVEDSTVHIAGENFLGGFIGAVSSSYAVDCNLFTQNELTMNGSGDCVGGFAGTAQAGWSASLGASKNQEKSLLGLVRQLATGLLSTNPALGKQLLTITGASPSVILGCQMDCSTMTVNAGGSFAGGIVGKGNGLYIGANSDEMLDRLKDWKIRELLYDSDESPSGREISLAGLHRVSAGGNYAGGVAGALGTAAISGVIDDVIGIGNFIKFAAEDISVTGGTDGYTVTAASDGAGGGFGSAVGGEISRITVLALAKVEADNRAGGFAGTVGPGELIGTGGLTLNLLGLNHVLALSNLLSIGEVMSVEIQDCSVTGINSGFEAEATGAKSTSTEITAAGFIARSHSADIDRSHVYQLKSVMAPDTNGYAGGYLGTSVVGGLADVADENAVQDLLGDNPVIGINNLLTAIGYLIPSYTNCSVHYVDGGFVDADIAGGFVADMQSGTIDNETHREHGNPDYYSVYNIDRVKGRTFGGGFGGRVVSGGLAEAGKGISILGDSGVNLNASNLISVMDVYVPIVKYAGVNSPSGFTVVAKDIRTGRGQGLTGSAGGFIGYASGAQVSYSDVYRLKKTTVVPPDELEAVNAPSYFNNSSSYAVTGGRFSGGYVGNMDIGSAASIGEGLSALELLNVSNVVSALSVVVSSIEHSNVYGCPGGFAVLAAGDGDNAEGIVGRSGGFAGNIEGGHIQDSHAVNFSYIIGQVSAGGYVGSIEPGSVAKLLGDAELGADGQYTDNNNILSKLLGVADISSSLMSLIKTFVPTIRNSTCSAIPCGGAVRAQAASDSKVQRGMAGGYVGHNEGAQLWGNNTSTWLTENDGNGRVFSTERTGNYTGNKSLCKADRIRSVYGYEYAGGFTGYMECASTAKTGNIILLGGLIQANSVLDALKAVYPTEENTAVYGPLRNLDMDTWNMWIDYVGKYGGYGQELAAAGKVSSTKELEKILSQYIYGYHVVAGRSSHDQSLITEGGDAGGYVGLMRSGVITNGQAYDAKKIVSMRSAGGYAGRLLTGGAAEFGGVKILSFKLNIGNLLKAAEIFVPVIKSSSVKGYRGGLTVTAKGIGDTDDITFYSGYAGGYAGSIFGGQIWGDKPVGEPVSSGCNVTNLRRVKGRNGVGGYVGFATAAAVASLNTNTSQDMLQNILNSIVNNQSQLLNVLQGTISTIRGAQVTAVDPAWGFVVEGPKSDIYPLYAGGFAGFLEATVLGSEKGESDLTVNGLRSVDGQLYAGGFFGLADVSSLASISPNATTSLLSLVQAGNVSILDIFRTYIYHGDVTGVLDGYVAEAHSSETSGYLSETRYAGCAGGYGGGLMNGHVENSHATNLNTVKGLNYVGGFIGHMGKNGIADVDSAKVGAPLADLLNAAAGIGDVFGAHAELCSVKGIDDGIVVRASGGEEEIAGGFAGYADLSRIKDSEVINLKQVYSEEIAGGFVGKTNMKHLIELEANSVIVSLVAGLVSSLLQLLSIDSIEDLLDSSVLNIPLAGGLTLADLGLLKNGNLISLNLLGILITVSLATDGHTALLTIGDSRIEIDDPGSPNIDQEALTVELFKANATKVERSKVTGIGIGYDVYGGGASNQEDGAGSRGYAGGFVGLNQEGRMICNEMVYCDVVRGAPRLTGPFSGKSLINSVYPSYSDLKSIEGFRDGGYNVYHVYRNAQSSLLYLLADENKQAGEGKTINTGTAVQETVATTGAGNTYNRYDINHLDESGVVEEFQDWKDAVMSTDMTGTNTVPVKVYISNAKAVLMDDNPTTDNNQSLVPEIAELQDPCGMEIELTIQKIWKDRINIDGIRPDEIEVRILRSATEVTYSDSQDPDLIQLGSGSQTGIGDCAEGEYIPLTTVPNVVTDSQGWFIISKAEHGRAFSAAWTMVIRNLPAAESKTNPDGTETITYYTYKVEEKAVSEYNTAISYDSRGYTATITNTHMPLLPMAGGRSDWMYVLGGLLLILLGILRWKGGPLLKGMKKDFT